ncbi:anion transporter [candidate division WOR-3 bacterium]|nr:anion transporter [candidate division WOR-3 bacterium]
MWLPIVVLGLVFLLIAVRQVGNVRLPIWLIMLAGALMVLLAGSITPGAALRSINLDVMLFLAGMFVLGGALEESGYLSYLSYRLFRRARTTNELLLMILFGMGLASALLMNDTVAIIGTPIVLLLARKHNISPKALLLALAFAITIGSVPSPIGNPQNLLIATGAGVKNPFVVFFVYLAVPSAINILVAFGLLKLFYHEHFNDQPLNNEPALIADRSLARLCRWSLLLLLLMVGLKVICASFRLGFDFRLTYIALGAALPVLLFSPKRWRIIRLVDWHTLLFFAAMFVLMQAVWDTGCFHFLLRQMRADILSVPVVLGVSVLFSQLISNVPLVALLLPLLNAHSPSARTLMALAAGSTVAGNLFILGAASNVIIIQNAEKKAGESLTFWEFARIGVILTTVNCLIYWGWLLLF